MANGKSRFLLYCAGQTSIFPQCTANLHASSSSSTGSKGSVCHMRRETDDAPLRSCRMSNEQAEMNTAAEACACRQQIVIPVPHGTGLDSKLDDVMLGCIELPPIRVPVSRCQIIEIAATTNISNINNTNIYLF